MNIYSEILRFSNTLPVWQQEAFRRILKNQNLMEMDLQAILALAKLENGLAEYEAGGKSAESLKESEIPNPESKGNPVLLTKVRNLKNVSALVGDQEISFGKGLTVIYGENGSGKSSYARLLKKAFRARGSDELQIFPDVFAQQVSKEPASAIFEFNENGNVQIRDWVVGKESDEIFGKFAVHDSKCARLYFTKKNEIALKPYGIHFFEELIQVVDWVKGELKRQGEAVVTFEKAMEGFARPCATGGFISSLSSNTELGELEEKLAFSEEDLKETVDLQNQIGKLSSSSPEKIKARIEVEEKRIEMVRTIFSEFETQLGKGAADGLANLVKQIKNDKELEKELADRLAKAVPGTGVGTNEWKAFFEKLQSYFKKLTGAKDLFPRNVDDICLLCQRKLDEDSFAKIRAMVKMAEGEVAKRLAEGEEKLAEIQTSLDAISEKLPEGMASLEGTFQESGLDIFGLLKSAYSEVVSRKSEIKKAKAGNELGKLPEFSISFLGELAKAKEVLEGKKGELKDQASINEQIEKLKRKELELVTRREANKNIEQIRNHVKGLKAKQKFQEAHSGINSRKISEKSKSLQKEFVTEEFKKNVRVELDKTGLKSLKAVVDDQSPKGKLIFQINVNSDLVKNPEDIFSEGERTALSLACFLAELSSLKISAGIVLDDPISSLDHRIRGKVVERLVGEAKKRQVVIFTHDLVFLTELLEHAHSSSLDPHVQVVESINGSVGFVESRTPWAAAKSKDRVKALRSLLESAETKLAAGSKLEYQGLVSVVVSRLRATWERAVEEKVLGGVVSRFSKVVHTQELKGVVVDTELITKVFEGMTKTSNLVDAHDAAAAENRPGVDTASIRELLDEVDSFIKLVDTKRKAISDREHLNRFNIDKLKPSEVL